jgi:hypothetical protein
MKTKEGIKNQVWEAIKNGCQLDSDLREDSETAVIDCANIAIEYAKEVAIDFVKWYDECAGALGYGVGRSLSLEELYDFYSGKTKELK